MYEFVPSVCSYCGVGCGVLFEVLDGQLLRTLPLKTHPVNQGKLCIKGWNLHEYVNSSMRLKSPLLKLNGRFHEVTWDRAVQFAADKLQSIINQYGPDSVGVLASAKITNEENYLLQKFARAVVGTNNVDHCARLCHASTVVGLAAAFGSGAMTNSIAEIDDAACIFIIGSNTSVAHPLIARRVLRAREKGARLFVADPRYIQLSRFAEVAVNQRLGSDVALLNGMMHLIVKNAWEAKDYIAERTEGFAELRESLAAYTPQRVQEITGVSSRDLEKMSEIYATHRPAAIVYTMGITQHTTGVDNVKAICNLAMLTGNVGIASGGVNPLRGQNNVQGACDMGGLPNVFSGYQPVNNSEAHAKFSRAWGRSLPQQPGLTLPDMIRVMEAEKLKALYVVGENPKLSDPDGNHLRHAFDKLDLLIVQDLFLSETAQGAHVVFPAASTAELAIEGPRITGRVFSKIIVTSPGHRHQTEAGQGVRSLVPLIL
jgi:predicted molibdopterin-dependent oxidoreductase YjgC